MKRTFPINIDGGIFYIDEDAYSLLNSYIDQLHNTFKGCEGNEIVADIESRIRELFDDRIAAGSAVITLVDVNNVIETMGRPEELEENEGANTNTEDNERPPIFSFNMPTHKRLFRNMKNKVFGGVVGGLAVYLGWHTNIMRLILMLLTIFMANFGAFWFLPVVYLIAWMIIPAATTPMQVLEMNGTPRNIDTLGRAVIATQTPSTPASGENVSFFTTVFSIMGKCLMGIFGIAALFVCLFCLASIFAVVAGLIANSYYGDASILERFDMVKLGSGMISFVICILLFGTLISGCICYGAASVLMNLRGFTKTLAITLLIFGVVLFLISATLGILAFSA